MSQHFLHLFLHRSNEFHCITTKRCSRGRPFRVWCSRSPCTCTGGGPSLSRAPAGASTRMGSWGDPEATCYTKSGLDIKALCTRTIAALPPVTSPFVFVLLPFLMMRSHPFRIQQNILFALGAPLGVLASGEAKTEPALRCLGGSLALVQRIPGGTRQNDGLETGIMGGCGREISERARTEGRRKASREVIQIKRRGLPVLKQATRASLPVRGSNRAATKLRSWTWIPWIPHHQHVL